MDFFFLIPPSKGPFKGPLKGPKGLKGPFKAAAMLDVSDVGGPWSWPPKGMDGLKQVT